MVPAVSLSILQVGLLGIMEIIVVSNNDYTVDSSKD